MAKLFEYDVLRDKTTMLDGKVRAIVGLHGGYIEVTAIDGGIAIHASLPAHHRLLIHPRVSNSIEVLSVLDPEQSAEAIRVAKHDKKHSPMRKRRKV